MLAPRPDADGSIESEVVVRSGRESLDALRPELEELAQNTLEPNVFYEPSALFPALAAFGAEYDVQLVLVYCHDPARPGRKVLSALWPLEHKRRFRGAPVHTLALWKHRHCFLATPLVHRDWSRPAVHAFFDWLCADGLGAELLEFVGIRADGPLQQHVIDELHRRALLSLVYDRFTRALFVPGSDAESYLALALSGKHRKELRRQEKRLSDSGTLRYAELQADEDVEPWIEAFMALEASGWKGEDGGAFARQRADASFFRQVASSAHQRGQLMMLALELNGRKIAMKCNLLSGAGSFAFKIAYDEQFARFSPGMLLELHNIRALHERRGIDWMDSCASRDHFMANRIWLDRRTIETTLIATGRGAGNALVASLPMFRLLGRARQSVRARVQRFELPAWLRR